MQLSFIGAGMEKVDKAPLIWQTIMLFTDETNGKKVPEEYKGQLFFTWSPSMIVNLNIHSQVSEQNYKIRWCRLGFPRRQSF